MASDLILITGATGHIGFHVLVEALSKGYKVRAAVRSDEKFHALKEAMPLQPYLSQLTHIVVPGIGKEGAYDEAVKDVSYVVHIASPLAVAGSPDDMEGTIIRPAINATIGLLRSAFKEPSIKKVVITSSAAAVMPDTPSTAVFTPDTLQPDPQGPYPNPIIAYFASKKLSYSATRSFIASQNPHFDIINIMPSFVIGPQGLATSKVQVPSGSNRHVFMPLLGQQNPTGLPAGFAHTSDVAYVHIAALSNNVRGSQNFGVSNRLDEQSRWDDSIDIVKKHFSAEVASGLFPLGGSVKSIPMPFDTSRTEEFFGIKFKSFEEMVKDAVGQYVELAKSGA